MEARRVLEMGTRLFHQRMSVKGDFFFLFKITLRLTQFH